MSGVDWTQKRSAEDIASVALEARRIAVNGECERRIFSVASANAQRNLIFAQGLALATPEADRTNADVEILAGCRAAMSWVNDMRAAAADLCEGSDDFTVDGAWPDLPDGVSEMLELI